MRLKFTSAVERARHYDRYLPFIIAILLIPLGLALAGSAPILGVLLAMLGLAGTCIGFYDLRQTSHALMRNYPLASRMRYLLEHFRPEIRQYFVENDHDETPFSREQRAVVYRRAKGIEGVRPFGTLRNVYDDGYEWLNHSVATTHLEGQDFRIRVGGPDCKQPYDSSVVNISGMSYGALSPNAIEALNRAAKAGGFAHTTGEGSISRFHRMGGDLIWQIGSGYFGCRHPEGSFNPGRFAEIAVEDAVKMIEIKLSQGAKPGHGGILPGPKVTEAIAEARGVAEGVDCISPSSHSVFSTPRELCGSFVSCASFRVASQSGSSFVWAIRGNGSPWPRHSARPESHPISSLWMAERAVPALLLSNSRIIRARLCGRG